jgi:antitoxin VapB
MRTTAKLFKTGRSQAVRLPLEYRFTDCDEVFIRRDPETGDVILSNKPADWRGFVQAREAAQQAGEIPDDFPNDFPGDFPGDEPRDTPAADRDPFSDWRE